MEYTYSDLMLQTQDEQTSSEDDTDTITNNKPSLQQDQQQLAMAEQPYYAMA